MRLTHDAHVMPSTGRTSSMGVGRAESIVSGVVMDTPQEYTGASVADHMPDFPDGCADRPGRRAMGADPHGGDT